MRWEGAAPPAIPPIGAGGWLRVLLRGAPLAVVTFAGLALLLLLRLPERALFGPSRPVTPHITEGVCRAALRILGIGHSVSGAPMSQRGVIVANHSSWLDIFALNACQRIYFVSKAEVARWPAIGWLARATGTVFITRDPREARSQQRIFEERLRAGHRLLFFPEGTSTDGRHVLPFKPTLFAALFTHGLEHAMHVQPVSVTYHAPAGADPRFYGWWGDMDFGSHLLKVLAAPRQGRVEVVFHPPVAADAFASRKELAAACEAAVRSGVGHQGDSGDRPVRRPPREVP